MLLISAAKVSAAPSAESSSRFCTTVKYDPNCNCNTNSPLLTAAYDQCLIEMKANECEKYAADHPKAKEEHRLRECTQLSSCSTLNLINETLAACAGGSLEAGKDLIEGAWLFLSGQAGVPSQESLAKMDYFKNCTSAECKHKMLGPFASYFSKEEIEGHAERTDLDSSDPANGNYLNGYSSAVLYRKLLIRLKKESEGKTMNQKFIEPWSGKEARTPKSLLELADDLLSRMGITHAACYKAEVVTEMRCYALASVLLPYGAASASSKILRLAGLPLRELSDATASLSKLSPENSAKYPLKSNRQEAFRLATYRPSIPAEFIDRSTDTFKVVRVYDGQHGGKRLAVERQAGWGDPRKHFVKDGGDITLDLRLWPTTLGSKEADYFGFRVVDDKFVILPDEKEIAGAIRSFNSELPPGSPDRVALNFYGTKDSFISARRYVERFAKKGEKPISRKGRQFYHDISGHSLEGFLFNNEFSDVLRARSNLWLDFVDSQKNLSVDQKRILLEADKQVTGRLTNEIDQTANMMGAFLIGADQNFLVNVGKQISQDASKKLPRGASWKHLSTSGHHVISGYTPSKALTQLVSAPPNDFFVPILEKENAELAARFRAFVKERSSTDPTIYKEISFDWQKDVEWLNQNRERIKKGDKNVVEEFANLELTKPFFRRMNRLQELVRDK